MNMDRKTEILHSLERILKEQCATELKNLDPEQRLQEDLGLDSMGLLALTVEVENFFRIHLDEDLSDPPQTLGALADLVHQRLLDAGR